MAIEAQNVTITDRGARTSTGVVRIESWDKKTRTSRALKAWGACWAVAIPAVFIPIAHFILVPGLLLGGVITAVIRLGQKDVVLGGEGTCPTCGKPLTIVRGAPQWPLSDMCAECQSIVSIEKRA